MRQPLTSTVCANDTTHAHPKPLSDEYGRLAVTAATTRLNIGKIRLVLGHCDPTVNLYDWYVGIRRNRVETP